MHYTGAQCLRLFFHTIMAFLVRDIVCLQLDESGRSELSRNITKILNQLVNKSNYDKRLRPNYGGPPVSVGITIYVSSISAVSEVEMDYTLDIYLRQMWRDNRLEFQGVSKNSITIDVEYMKSIWVPDTFFPNEKKSFFHTATTHNSFLRIMTDGNDYTLDFYLRQHWQDPRLKFNTTIENIFVNWEYVRDVWVPDTFFPNEKKSDFHVATTHNSFLRIKQTGDVLTSQRLTVTASCPMELHLFPLDSQECNLEIESYGYSTVDIKYSWFEEEKKEAVTLGDIILPQFKIVGYEIQTKEVGLSTGKYSRLICRFLFSRSIGFYFIQIYLPSVLIVVISWVSFWLSRDATPARVALGVTTVLTMTTLMTTTNASMPKVSYVKSIDIYLGTCFMMVFASLLEYAAVGYLNKRLRMRRDMNRFDNFERSQSLRTASESRSIANDASNTTSTVGASANFQKRSINRYQSLLDSPSSSSFSVLVQLSFIVHTCLVSL